MLNAGLALQGRAGFGLDIGGVTLSRTGPLGDQFKTVTNLCVICAKCTVPQFVPLKLIGLSTTKRIRQVLLTPYQVLGLKLP